MTILSIPLEFILFALTLMGIALFHNWTLQIALSGLAVITTYKLTMAGFSAGPGLHGLAAHAVHEVPTLANLFLLLTGFAVLARQFEESRIPDAMPSLFPDNWTGGLWLLALIFVLSAFLDNIAAALIGGTVARHVFKDKVHIGYLAAIVAAANAGGSGSVIGDTTTTMMWVAGVSPLAVFKAYAGAVAAFFCFAIPASRQQHSYAPITKDPPQGLKIDHARVAVTLSVLMSAVAVNVWGNAAFPDHMGKFPALGLAVWAAIMAAALIRPPDWRAARNAVPGTIFLLALVMAASMMPVETLPAPTWKTAFGLGTISAVFDNIPLTALALKQGGYDWGVLAYAVGFGGSMIWFGSSAGVAISNMYPEAKSAVAWLKAAWYVPPAYVIGFAVMVGMFGWAP
jgi:Na+/H+ antiporter NhaD/arsenite permease-like protein